jgi:tocopherol O-methyltransferase
MLAGLAGTRSSSAQWRPPFGLQSLQGYNGNHPGGQRLESVQAAHVTMPRPNDKRRIIKHYDLISPFYRSLWGEHLHHGYWIRGDESKEKAQLQLIEHLAQLANVKSGSDILDIGCGFGGSSLYLAKNYNATVTGINTSPVQVEMATEAAAREKLAAKFVLMDADAIDFDKQFDLLWSVESISHYQRHKEFFASTAKLLKPGGHFAITDWFKKDNLTREENKRFIEPIEKGMLVELRTMDDYERLLTLNGLQIRHRQVLNENCVKTWDLGLDIIKDKAYWALAAKLGADLVSYLKAFQAVRAGFASGNFVYGLFVASSISDA